MPRSFSRSSLIASAFGAGFLSVTPSAAHAQEQDAEIWIGATVSGPISGPLLGSVETTLRIDDANTSQPARVIRPMLGYQLSKPVSLWIGYTRVEQFPAGRPQATENRLFQQVSWNMGKLGSIGLSSRTRLEQRSFSNGGGSALRLREQLKAAIPLHGTNASIIISTEPFVTLQTSVPGADGGFEQWRNSLGVSVALSKSVAVEVGYLNRYIVRHNAPDKVDHIMPLALNYRF